MSFTAFTNVITILFCLAVLIQSVRMLRSLKQMREAQFDRTVGALDTATAKASAVLSELKGTLTTDGAANLRALSEAREVREELNLMVGIANAMAERLVEAASDGSDGKGSPASAPAKTSRKPRTAPARKAKATKPKADKPATGRAKRVKTPETGGPAVNKALSKKPPRRKSSKSTTLPADAKEAA
ncbi:DUF6468 domain-containing protein [Pseudoblastomonas halimionae]|uniref:DUF6468 domain-containing protein n=1 Tax=Alteriqipengyuania halimionae TaxID=1926630 RepID=A0A6I4U6D3_9SPHN|nr:DUF6468 domain-containing protein [Alteriqipengyuania halimionae]MXP10423.1 hypothetical protein [Alteriqipengyuania halimionae]